MKKRRGYCHGFMCADLYWLDKQTKRVPPLKTTNKVMYKICFNLSRVPKGTIVLEKPSVYTNKKDARKQKNGENKMNVIKKKRKVIRITISASRGTSYKIVRKVKTISSTPKAMRKAYKKKDTVQKLHTRYNGLQQDALEREKTDRMIQQVLKTKKSAPHTQGRLNKLKRELQKGLKTLEKKEKKIKNNLELLQKVGERYVKNKKFASVH